MAEGLGPTPALVLKTVPARGWSWIAWEPAQPHEIRPTGPTTSGRLRFSLVICQGIDA